MFWNLERLLLATLRIYPSLIYQRHTLCLPTQHVVFAIAARCVCHRSTLCLPSQHVVFANEARYDLAKPFVGQQPVGNLRWKASVDVTPDGKAKE